ncbi:MAG: helix-turn-helix transcriptional regulator [Bacteroidales bacterium]|nr:helix-turn-helix transcriptional regulator [Bacteroidales bacterium]
MADTVKYKSTDKLRNLVRDNSSLLMVMSRFGISSGFGEKSVDEVCCMHGVDVATFLAVANLISGKENDYRSLSLPSLIGYLRRAHTYFLDYNLPTIRRRLIEALDCSGSDDVAFLILKFYDEYVTEVRKHMEYEDTVVFTYVDDLLQNRMGSGFSISVFSGKHNHIDVKLKELKDIVISYYPNKCNDMLNSVLFDIINCEQDLASHCNVEDMLFVPAVEELERRVREQGGCEPVSVSDEPDTSKADILTQREKEIVVCIAKGMSNKEVADALNLSVHTVTTHRRNISNKLQIHSPAGITIYAIVNRLLDLHEIQKMQ